jgi:transposase
VKSNKNDAIDAAAIAEALTRPTMRFGDVKQPEQVDLQALHRIRDQMVGGRTRLICQMRAFCLEYGVPIRQGAGVFKIDLPRVVADESNDLTSTMRRLLLELFEDLKRLEVRIAEVTREIEGLAASNEKARRLMTILGIGPIAATALLAAAAMGSSSGRLATWPRGLESFRSNIRREAKPKCAVLASAEIDMSAGC